MFKTCTSDVYMPISQINITRRISIILNLKIIKFVLKKGLRARVLKVSRQKIVHKRMSHFNKMCKKKLRST